MQGANWGKFSMNVRHNDDDRPNPSGIATIAERRGSHDASLGEWRCGSAGWCSQREPEGKLSKGKTWTQELFYFENQRSVVQITSSSRGQCFCFSITMCFFKISEIVVFEHSRSYLIQLVFLKHHESLIFWNESLWKYVQVFGIKCLLMSYIALDWFAWLARAGHWEGESGCDRTRGDWPWSDGTGPCEPTLAPGAALPNAESVVTSHYRTDKLFVNSFM